MIMLWLESAKTLGINYVLLGDKNLKPVSEVTLESPNLFGLKSSSIWATLILKSARWSVNAARLSVLTRLYGIDQFMVMAIPQNRQTFPGRDSNEQGHLPWICGTCLTELRLSPVSPFKTSSRTDVGRFLIKSTDFSTELYWVCPKIMIDLIYLSSEYIYRW